MKKRRKNTRRRKSNPSASRRRVTVKVNGRRGHRVHARRRRNPAQSLNLSQLAELALFGAGGAILTETASSLLPLNQYGPVVSLLGKGAVAYGIGYLSTFVGVTKPHAEMIAAGGLVGVAKDVINQFVLPTVQGVFAPRPAPAAVAAKNGVSDIVALPRGSSDSYWGTSPNLSGVRRGMNNIVAVPRG